MFIKRWRITYHRFLLVAKNSICTLQTKSFLGLSISKQSAYPLFNMLTKVHSTDCWISETFTTRWVANQLLRWGRDLVVFSGNIEFPGASLFRTGFTRMWSKWAFPQYPENPASFKELFWNGLNLLSIVDEQNSPESLSNLVTTQGRSCLLTKWARKN